MSDYVWVNGNTIYQTEEKLTGSASIVQTGRKFLNNGEVITGWNIHVCVCTRMCVQVHEYVHVCAGTCTCVCVFMRVHVKQWCYSQTIYLGTHSLL